MQKHSSLIQLKEARDLIWQNISSRTSSAERATATCKVVVTTTQAELEGQTVNLSGNVSEYGAELARLSKEVSGLRH